MATEAELESMVVRLLGDGSSYQKMMKQAQVTAAETAARVGKSSNHIDGFGDQLSRFGELSVAALQIYGTTRFLQAGIQAWEEQEAAAIKLNTILEVNGRQVQELTGYYNDFAAEMQRVTTMADEVTLGILAQAESFGLTGEAARKATQDAVAFAAVNGGSAESYLRFTAAMARGDAERMRQMARMIPQLRGIKDEEELVAKAAKLAEAGFKLAQEQAKTLGGQLKQLHNAWGEILEDVGRVTSEALKPFVAVAKDAVEWLQKLDEKTKNVVIVMAMVAAALVSVGPLMATVNAAIVPLIGMIGSGFALIGKVALVLISPFVILKAAVIAAGVAFATVFSPIGAVLAAIALVVVGLVRRVGGARSAFAAISDFFVATWTRIKDFALRAWDYIQARAMEFYDWIVPIADAAAQFIITSWQLIKQGAMLLWDVLVLGYTKIWEFIKSVFGSIVGESNISWTSVRDHVQRAIIAAEFTLLNFKDVARVAWLGIKYYALAAINAIMEANQRMADELNSMFENLGINIRLNLRVSAISEAARSAAQEFAAAQGQMEANFEQFYNERIRQFARIRNTAEDQKKNPIQPILDTAQAVTKEIAKWDAALFRSSEAVSRIIAFRERAAGERSVAPAISGSRSSSNEGQQRIISLLAEVVRQVTITAARPPVNVQGAGLS